MSNETDKTRRGRDGMQQNIFSLQPHSVVKDWACRYASPEKGISFGHADFIALTPETLSVLLRFEKPVNRIEPSYAIVKFENFLAARERQGK